MKGSASNLNQFDRQVYLTSTAPEPVCANTYVWDMNEEPVSCCSTLVSPNRLYAASANQDLLANRFLLSAPSTIRTRLVISAPSGGVCNPASPGDLRAGCALGSGRRRGAPGFLYSTVCC